jgi:alkaline phosphatase
MKKIIALCFISAQLFAQKAPKNIIFLIGDGMGVSQIYAGLTANRGHLNLERIKVIGFHKNQASNNYVTDSAAGATAFATGKQTYNGAIGLDSLRVPATTLLEMAEQKGLATGLVSTCDITDATPSSFIAHQLMRSMHEEIAGDFLKTDKSFLYHNGYSRLC